MFRENQPYRKTVEIEGIEETNWQKVPVEVLGPVEIDFEGEPDEGWKVRIPITGKVVEVFADQLSPCPDQPEMIHESFARLFDGFESPLVGAAACEAICSYAKHVSENEAEMLKAMEGGMVHGPAWIEAAKRAAEIVETKKSGA